MRFLRSVICKSLARVSFALTMLLMIAPSGAFADAIPAGSHATVRINTSLSSATASTGRKKPMDSWIVW